MSDARQDSLSLTLVLPAEVRAGGRVPITLRVENHERGPLDLYLRGRTTTFDVEVTDTGGTVVWRRLEGEIIPAIVHLRTLAPGERFEIGTTWDQRTTQGRPIPPGAYSVRGLLLVEGKPLETVPVPLRIVAR